MAITIMADSFTGLSFEVLFNTMSEAMLLVNDTGHVVLANPVAQNLLGYAESELINMTVEQLMPIRYREHHLNYRQTYLNDPRQRAMGKGRNLVLLNRAGQELAVDIRLSPIKINHQLYVLATLNSTNQLHQVEDALEASEERLQLAKQAANLGIFDFDFEHNTIHWDNRMQQIWENSDSSDGTITYEKFTHAIHPKDLAIYQTTFDKATDPSGDGEFHTEFRVIHPDGTICWVAMAGQVHFEEGHPSRLLGMARDITPRKTLEEELKIQRAETETLFKQQVAIHTASAIAHELNQPLTAISAYSEVALHVVENDQINNPEIKRALKGCVEQAQRAGQSLHELVDFLQKGEISTEKINLNKIVMDALRIARSDGYSEFHVQVHLEPHLPTVLANRLHIQKSLVNLLRNAVEAMRTANIAPSAITITVKTLQEKNMAMVTVQDNGPGVEQAIIQQIFEPFFTTKPTGIGMGLSISRTLIEANGGQLWLDPDTKEGAKFHFTLPFAS